MEDLTGKQLGPYRIIAPIGEGGMSVVYKAYQADMDRCVAVKVLPRQLALYPEYVGRFHREAKVIARLVHPHILPVHDYGHAEGFTYLVMPYIQGSSLAQMLTGRPLSLPQIVHIMTELADALDYAHACGVVHRDIKPGNVLLDQRGHCLLTDFGLAQVVEEATRYTQAGMAVGTPAYMSPEQGRGDTVDARSDIYSLGVVLYEMATGAVPFNADTPVAILLKHIRDPLPSARALNPALPAAVEAVIGKALAKAPSDRFASACEMAQALQAALASPGPAAVAAPFAPGAGRRATPATPRSSFSPVLAVIIAGGLVLAGVTVIASGWVLASMAAQVIGTAKVTPVPSEGRIGPPVLDPLAGSVVQYVDHFDGTQLRGWQPGLGSHAALDASCLVLTGEDAWQAGQSLEAKLAEGQAVLVLFEFEPDAQFRLAVNAGGLNTPDEQMWGWQRTSAGGFAPYLTGMAGAGEPKVVGQMTAEPDHWYLAYMRIGGQRQFTARVWEQDAPERFLEWRQAMPASWTGLKWNVSLEPYTGRLIIDRYEQLAFGQPPD